MNSDTLRNRRTKRTTLTLEADVADYIQKTLSRNKQLKEKQLINRLLRLGINNEQTDSAAPFKIKGFRTTMSPDISPEAIEQMLDEN